MHREDKDINIVRIFLKKTTKQDPTTAHEKRMERKNTVYCNPGPSNTTGNLTLLYGSQTNLDLCGH